MSIALSIQVEQQLIRRQQGLWAVLTCLVDGIETQASVRGVGRDAAAAAQRLVKVYKLLRAVVGACKSPVF